MDTNEELVLPIRKILKEGHPLRGESKEDADFRQIDELMELWVDEE
tara:strand:- start:1386 stop:1523 length:138 start_codon:yes stop_codon:yes gene_type:complete